MKRAFSISLFIISMATWAQDNIHFMKQKEQNQAVVISGQKIAYRTMGEGTPIILLNRFRGIMDIWDPLFIDGLAKHHQLIVFDYPEIGDSEGNFPKTGTEISSFVIELADSLGIEKFHVLGWSFGGLVAQSVTFQYPDRVLKTIIIGSNPVGENKVPFEPAFFERALKPVNDLDDETVLFFEPRSLKSREAAKQSHARIYQNLDASKIPATQELMQKYLETSKDIKSDAEGLRERFVIGKQPFLVIQGDHDISFSVKNWYPLIQKAQNLQLFVLPEAGHAPHHQSPELITGYIDVFLDTEEL